VEREIFAGFQIIKNTRLDLKTLMSKIIDIQRSINEYLQIVMKILLILIF